MEIFDFINKTELVVSALWGILLLLQLISFRFKRFFTYLVGLGLLVTLYVNYKALFLFSFPIILLLFWVAAFSFYVTRKNLYVMISFLLPLSVVLHLLNMKGPTEFVSGLFFVLFVLAVVRDYFYEKIFG